MKEPVLPDFPPPPPGAPLHSHASDAPGSSHDSLDLPDPPLPPLPNKANPFLQKGIGGVPQEHPDEADIPLPPPPAEAIHKAQSADPAKSIPQESALPDLPPPPLPEIPCPEEEQPSLPQSESSRQMIHYRLRQQYACLPLLLPDRYHLPSRNRRFRTCLPVRIRNLPLQKENFPIPSDSSPVHQAANCLLRRPRTAGILLSRQRG